MQNRLKNNDRDKEKDFDSPFFGFEEMFNPPDAQSLNKHLINKLHSRRVDDSLLNLLSEVLACNSEYSKSVAVLLDSESIKAENLEEIQEEIKKLRILLEKLLESEEGLLAKIDETTEEYKKYLDQSVEELQAEQQNYMTKKFAALFTKMGLKEDGSEHTPTDKFIVGIKNMLNHHVLSTVAMFILYHLAVYFLKIKFGN